MALKKRYIMQQQQPSPGPGRGLLQLNMPYILRNIYSTIHTLLYILNYIYTTICTTYFHVLTGSPQPTYRWLKDGTPVADYSSSQFYRLPITRREDAGGYQCIARNDVGSILSEKSDVVVACKYTTHTYAA